jgi:two-component system sensor histidine kinase MtrB
MARLSALTGLPQRVRRQPAVAVLRRTAGRRLLVAWAAARRAWRRSLQLRMVIITLLVSTVLVGAFGVLVASQITEGLVRNTVAKAGVKVTSGRDEVAIPQLGQITEPNDPTLPSTVGQVLSQLATSPNQGSVGVVALTDTDSSPQFATRSVPSVDNIDRVITRELRQRVAENRVAHQFVTANLGSGPRPYLVYGTPVPVPGGRFAL